MDRPWNGRQLPPLKKGDRGGFIEMIDLKIPPGPPFPKGGIFPVEKIDTPDGREGVRAIRSPPRPGLYGRPRMGYGSHQSKRRFV